MKTGVCCQEREDASHLTPRQLTGQASDLAQLLSSPSLTGSAASEATCPPLTASLLTSTRSPDPATAQVCLLTDQSFCVSVARSESCFGEQDPSLLMTVCIFGFEHFISFQPPIVSCVLMVI